MKSLGKVFDYSIHQSHQPIQDYQAGSMLRYTKMLRHRERGSSDCGFSGRAGMGSSTTPHYGEAKRKVRSVLVQDKVQASASQQDECSWSN